MLIAAVTKRHAANTRIQWSSKTNKSSQSLARNGLTHGSKCLPVQPQLSSLFSTAAKSKAGFELNQAAAAGDIGFLKKMVKDGVDINSVDYDQRTPLHVAAAEGNVDLCEYLLAQGASVNALDRWGNTPLMDALRSKRDEVVGVLKKHGGILSHNTEDVAASLCKAAKRGDLSELKRLIDSGADPNASDYDGRTPLHIAAAEGRVDMVQFLVSKGSNPNLVDRFGNTPLQDSLRIKSPNSKMLQKVLEKSGAVTEVDIQKFKYESKFFNELQKSLSLLCVKDSWPYAEAWVQSPDTNQIISTPSWFADANQVKTFASFRSASEKLKFELNQGYVGQGWAKPKPELFQTSDEIFAKHGIKTGVTIPIQFGSQTIAVIVLLDTKPRTSISNPSELFTFANRLFLFCFSALKKQNGEPLPVFEEQMNVVCNLIIQEKVFNSNLIFEEVDWFYNHLGIPDYYFQQFSPSEIAQHIHSFIAAKKVAQASGDKENIKFSIEKEESNFYICPSRSAFEIQVEKRIEKKMEEIFEFNRKNPTKAKASSVVYFQTNRPAIADGKTHLGMYVLNTTPFTHGLASEDQTDLWAVSSGIFMRDKTQGMKEKYQEILKSNSNRLSPVFEVLPKRADGTIPLMIGFTHRGSSEGFITSLSQLLHVNGIVCNRKFIETFANGAVICTLYISPVKEEIINRIFEQIGVLLILPPFSTAHPTITNLFLQGTISIEQYAYIISVTDFCYYFLNQRSEEYSLLANALKADPLNRGRLELLQRRLKRDAVTENRIFECVTQNFELMAEIYSEFEQNFSPLLATNTRKFNDKLAALIKKNVNSPLDEQILNTFLTFNRSLLKTNFFKKEKSALSFRFTPKFLSDSDFPETPFGLFLSVGMDYVGFHVRFRDISRGGIRIIKSANPQQYNKNRESLFNENYNLAYTQQKKNKDIPEFGSKGTILLSQNFQFNGKFAFRKYVDSLLDLMLLDEKKEVVDYYGQQELLFLGPDEYTAEYMDFAAEYAKAKGYKYWKSFTTGKSPRIGGIPHDVYGMTTRSIHRYVLGVLAKNELDESKVTKVQIGGPDGDLGSNEILISKDKTIAVVDGSGVVYDPRGVDRAELTRLAKQRSMIKDFDRTKLGAGGFVVLVTDREVQLPSGEVVESGLTFRNEFHLMPWLEADLFVPCGGRPESINAQNVDKIFKKDGSPRYKYIVEGANLFLTQDARLVLEKAGVVIYKDASANKGGVTSSSLEVLAALAFNDEEFSQHMQVKEGAIPAFYSQYVREVQEKVEENANLEFECIWQEHQRTKTPRSLLTDQLSGKINSLNDQIQCSNLWEDLELRTTTLTRAIPKSLIDKLGLQTIVQRVPESYVKAIFGAYLSSKYVYQFGFSATEFSFFEYMYQLRKGHPL